MNAGTRFAIFFVAFLFLGNLTLLGNGGSWPTGVPATGPQVPSAAAGSPAQVGPFGPPALGT